MARISKASLAKFGLVLPLALMTATGCMQSAGFLQATASNEGRVSADAFGNTHVQIGGRSFVLKPIDGKPVGNLAIQVAGRFYTTNNGAFGIPESALKDAQANSRGFFRVFAPGYVPKQVWIGQQVDDVPLTPILAIKVGLQMPTSGGQIRVPQSGLTVNVPAGMIDGTKANLAVSTYTPEATTDTAAALGRRQDFLAQLAKLKSGAAHYTLAQASGACAGAEQPLPCPPATAGLGIMLTVDGHSHPSVLTSQLDLATMAVQGNPAQQAAAARIKRTFDQIGAQPDAAAYKDLLASQYGLRLEGQVLTFSVQLGVNATPDGFAVVEVAGMDLLGVNLEVTAVSAVAGTLPASASQPALVAAESASSAATAANLAAAPGMAEDRAAHAADNLLARDGSATLAAHSASLTGAGPVLAGEDAANLLGTSATVAGLFSGNTRPSTLISQDGAGLITQDGAGLITQDGAGLITQDGAGLISNDGGSLVGHVEVPFTATPSKYDLLSYTSYPYPALEARVRLHRLDGTPISHWINIDSHSNYFIVGLPKTPAYFIVVVDAEGHKMRSLGMAPGHAQVTSNVNATTTAVTTSMINDITADVGNANTVTPLGYNADVVTLHPQLDQTQARSVVDPTKTVAQVATEVAAVKSTLSFVTTVITPLAVGRHNSREEHYDEHHEHDDDHN